MRFNRRDVLIAGLTAAADVVGGSTVATEGVSVGQHGQPYLHL